MIKNPLWAISTSRNARTAICLRLTITVAFACHYFHSSRDAMTARSRNGDMLLFKPVVLDNRLLLEITPRAGRNDVDFLLVKDPLRSLKRGDQGLCTKSR
jgi:hypothetical protein